MIEESLARPAMVYAKVIEGRKLQSTQWFGAQTPYCILWTNASQESKKQTKPFNSGGELPIWNDSFEFQTNDLNSEFLYLVVMNKTTLIGRAKIPCSELSKEIQEGWYKIYHESGKESGEIHLSVNYSVPEPEPGSIPRSFSGSFLSALTSPITAVAKVGTSAIHYCKSFSCPNCSTLSALPQKVRLNCCGCVSSIGARLQLMKSYIASKIMGLFSLSALAEWSRKTLTYSVNRKKEIIVCFVMFCVMSLGVYTILEPEDEYEYSSKFPPPPLWSHGSKQTFEARNGTTTDSLLYLKRAGFKPEAVLDVGAFHGKWSKTASVVFPEAEFFLVESSEDRKADMMSTGFPYVIATVGEKVQNVFFYNIPDNPGNSRFRSQMEGFASEAPVQKVSYPLDILLEDMPPIQMLKLDVQGSEVFALKGAKHLLKNVEVIFITVSIMQIHQGAPLALEVLSYCKTIGFELINYVQGETKGKHDALVHIELALAKADSPLFTKLSEGLVLSEDELKAVAEEERG